MSDDSRTPCPSCGDRCNDCGDRMCSTGGPEPAPRCAEHPCCSPCADRAVVYCWDCKALVAEVARDRGEQADFDASRESS